ncbi:MAG: MotA/TolQ/ExbB proton channel family protein [Planctomycetaceae bacterium]
MDATNSGESPDVVETAAAPADARKAGGSWLGSPLVVGGLWTVAFYALIPYLPMHRELVERYFCGHPMEYVLAGLFFLGMAILLRKALGVRAESAALASGLLDDPALTAESDSLRRASLVEERLNSLPGGYRDTVLATRVRDVCVHVRGRRSAAGLGDHLKYLADVAAERLYNGYALVRTITWAVPILGFLGTVIGITLAISNLTPEQLNQSLTAVTGGLGIAFDTTALALALSVGLVFTSFLVERSEQRILSRVEDFGVQRIVPLFPESAGGANPLAEAELHAARQLVARTDELIQRQTELWSQTLETTRGRWLEALEAQKRDFDASLQSGMQSTLGDHAEQLSATRIEFLAAFRSAAEEMHLGMAESREAQREMQATFGEHVEGLWSNIKADMQALQADQRQQMQSVAGQVSDGVSAWQEQLQRAAESGREQLAELRQQREVLLQLTQQEERLAELQHRLTENLAALRATESFEETLHSLSAAVHLLTARVRPQAA